MLLLGWCGNLAYFTEAQAEASYITDTQKSWVDGDFHRWTWSISGSDGMGHVLHSKTLTVNATLTQQKNEVKAHLTGSTQFYEAPVVIPISASVDYTITKLG